MKKDLQGLLLTLLVLFLCTSVEAQSYFSKLIGENSVDEKASRVGQLADGSIYIIASNDPIGTGNADVALHKLNSQGEEQWVKYYGDQDSEYPSSWVFDEVNGKITFLAESHNSDLTLSASIFQVDLEGEIIWNQEYNVDSGSVALRGIVKTEREEGYICVGFTSQPGGDNDYFVLRVDAKGTEIWRNIFGDEKNEFGACVQEISDGYMIYGDYGFTNSSGYRVRWLKLGFDGQVILDAVHDWSFNSGCKTSLKAKDGSIYVVGESATRSSPSFDVFLLKFDSNGEFLWEKLFEATDKGDAGFNICEVGTDTFLITGYSYNPQIENTDAYALMMDKNGNLLEKKFHDLGSNVDMGYDIIPSVQGGYLLAGSSTISQQNQIFLIYDTIDALPKPNGIPLPNDRIFKVYPNPTSDILIIEGIDQTITYKINSVNGSLIKSGHLKSGEPLELNELSSGVYFLNIQLDQQVQTHKIFIE